MTAASTPPAIQVHLCVRSGGEAIAFYERAFNATVNASHKAQDRVRYMHANLAVFGSEILLYDDFPEYDGDVRANDGGKPALAININVPSPVDVDAAIVKAVDAGAIVTMNPADQFWGARCGRSRDPFGHVRAFNAFLPPQS